MPILISPGRFLLLLLGLVIACLTTASVEVADRITPLQEVLQDKDGNLVPDRLGENFTISGVLTSEPVNVNGFGPNASEYACLVNVQDTTGAIVLFTRNLALLN